MNLYQVKTNKDWKCHYVLAWDWNEASAKVMEYLTDGESIIEPDGSIKLKEEVEIQEIHLLTNKLIR